MALLNFYMDTSVVCLLSSLSIAKHSLSCQQSTLKERFQSIPAN